MVEPAPGFSKGRSQILFSKSSEKSKRRKIEHLTKSDPAGLAFSTNSVFKNIDRSIAAKLIKFKLLWTLQHVSQMLNTYNTFKDFKYTNEYDEN